jgi:hypothetical protein
VVVPETARSGGETFGARRAAMVHRCGRRAVSGHPRIAGLEAENDELRERLESVEDHLGLETAADKGIPADD